MRAKADSSNAAQASGISSAEDDQGGVSWDITRSKEELKNFHETISRLFPGTPPLNLKQKHNKPELLAQISAFLNSLALTKARLRSPVILSFLGFIDPLDPRGRGLSKKSLKNSPRAKQTSVKKRFMSPEEALVAAREEWSEGADMSYGWQDDFPAGDTTAFLLKAMYPGQTVQIGELKCKVSERCGCFTWVLFVLLQWRVSFSLLLLLFLLLLFVCFGHFIRFDAIVSGGVCAESAET